jgi:hypothetical protein
MVEFAASGTIHAPLSKVWIRLADIGSFSEWNPGVIESPVSCRCNLGSSNFLDEEEATFVSEEAITLRIKYTNMPFKSVDIRFTLTQDENNPAWTIVTSSPICKLKYGPTGEFVDFVMVPLQYRNGLKNFLGGLKKDVEST